MSKNVAVLLMLSTALAAGCSSIAKGVTEGIIASKGQEVDTRTCHISGQAFEGVEVSILKQEAARREATTATSRHTTKVLTVHGIGTHMPGYSTRLAENLARALGLNMNKERAKEIDLQSVNYPDQSLGNLTIRRFFNRSRSREMLFYELTWSPITQEEKGAIAYDDSGEYSFRRAKLNNAMKEFLNDHISDPMIYLGPTRLKVITAVDEATCWMRAGDWDDLERYASRPCDPLTKNASRQVAEDDYVYITHSLGSRILFDTIQHQTQNALSRKVQALLAEGGSQPPNQDEPGDLSPDQIENLQQLLHQVQNKEFRVFMLANQLPLLELGREPPEFTGQIDQYCRADGPKRDARFMRRFSIVAFSDPNDVLSYAIPPKYADERMDSRMCPQITNVILNVAKVNDLFGLSEVANPLEAHVGYDNDERVIALIAKGIGTDRTDPVVTERCTWLEAVTE